MKSISSNVPCCLSLQSHESKLAPFFQSNLSVAAKEELAGAAR
jgi:hypothetical protein